MDGNTIKEVDSLDGFQYAGDILQFFPHAEGYVKATPVGNIAPGSPPTGYAYNYVYNYTDHLGNIRLSYTKDPQSGTLQILEENHYYPFGLRHEVYVTGSKRQHGFGNDGGGGDIDDVELINVLRTDYQYKYNGKELQDELGLNFYDYGARNYDPAIGRWMNVDPLAEKYFSHSSYTYTLNNPIIYVDPDGMRVEENDPPSKRTTQITQSFKYDKTSSGAKKDSGTDYIKESVQTINQNINGEGKYVTTTITDITVVSIDSDGNIDSEIEKTVFVHREISDGKGEIKYENQTSTGKLNFDTASPILKATSKNAATEKRNLGHSPLQDKADNINLGANVAVGSGLAVATGGSSLGYQLAAGATGTIVAEKALPKVTAEQVTKKLYHKKETLK